MRNWFSFSLIGILSFFLGAIVVWGIYARSETSPIEPVHHDPNVFISVQSESPRTAESISEIDISNPYALANSLDGYADVEMGELWKRLRVNSEMNDKFFTKCSACRAEAFAFNLDDSPQNEIIVRIANSIEECRYLVFEQIESDTTKYRLIGNIDHAFGRYEMPSHHFLVSNGRAYLIVRGQTVSGSGVSAYNYRLFRVKTAGLRSCLSSRQTATNRWRRPESGLPASGR